VEKTSKLSILKVSSEEEVVLKNAFILVKVG
jgi:hypothetical protein